MAETTQKHEDLIRTVQFLMTETMQKYKDLIRQVQTVEKESLERVRKQLEAAKPLAEKIRGIRKQYGLTGEKHFNFFTSISKNYKRENLHSDVLKTILDPKTMEIGNKKYLDAFVELVKMILEKKGKKTSENISFSNDTKVERETGRIDVFIYDEDSKKCIIVENKINNAPNMDDQLARYAKEAKDKFGNDAIVAIVYIPPIGDSTKPLPPIIEKYSPEYKELIPEIIDKLVMMPVLLPQPAGKDEKKEPDLVNEWLDKIADFDNISNGNIPQAELTARVYIHQYSNLLKGLEVDAMAYEFEVDLMRTLFKDEETRKTAADIAEVWNKKHELFFDMVKPVLRKEGFVDNVHKTYFGKVVSGDIFMYLGSNAVGFCAKNANMLDSVQNKLNEILGQSAFSDLHLKPAYKGVDFIYSLFILENLKGSLDDMCDTVVRCCRKLEEEAKKALENNS